REAKSAPLAAPLIASGPALRLDRSTRSSSEGAGGAERVGVGAGAGVGRGRGLGAGDRAPVGDESADGGAVGAEQRTAAVSAAGGRVEAGSVRAGAAAAAC